MNTRLLDYVRYALYGLVIALTLLVMQAWDKDHPAREMTEAPQTMPSTIPTGTTAGSQLVIPKPVVAVADPVPVPNQAHLIQVKTDVMAVTLDVEGGNIVAVNLLKYPQEQGSSQPFALLNDNPNTRYVAQSGLLSEMGPDTTQGQSLYHFDKADYDLAEGQDELRVTMTWKNAAGLSVAKTYVLHRNNYQIDLLYTVDNNTNQAWTGNLYLQLLRKNTPGEGSKGLINLATYFGAAVYDTPKKEFEKIKFNDMKSKDFNKTIAGGWAAMIQHYFVSAWVPDQNTQSQYFSHVTTDGLYTIGSLGSVITVNPHATLTTSAKFYAGPSVTKDLEKVAPGLPLTIDYGLFWIIAVSLFWLMQQFYHVVGNWGWSIVLVTLTIKLAFYHLSAKSYRSMSMMKKLQPRLNALKERYGNDKQKFTQETMALYRKENVNPMSGCLPMLIQIPVFIGLYWVLIEAVQLRQAPWIFWIHDLSQKDPFYILPILMGIAMFLQQRLSPPAADPMQAKVMMFMPVVFTLMFMNFPAGLMLYWFVNTSLSFLQQWYIMRSIDKVIVKK